MREALVNFAVFAALMGLASFWVEPTPGAGSMDYLMSLVAGAFVIVVLLLVGMLLLWVLLGLPGLGGLLQGLFRRKD